MPLLPPTVVGPLSECNDSVEVSGQRIGALVRVFANGRLVAQGNGSWSPQAFPLMAGERLNAAEEVFATQEFGGEASDRSLRPVVVQARAPEPGSMAFAFENNQCGECVMILGAVPGATVKVAETRTDADRGSGAAPHGVARFKLSPANQAGEVLVAKQRACDVEFGAVPAAPTRPISPNTALPRPVIEPPLQNCGHAVTISNALVGATITLRRGDGAEISALFDAPRLFFFVDPPLHQDEVLLARQEFPACPAIHRTESLPVRVGPTEPVPIPWLDGPICPGAPCISVSNLQPGALLRVFVDGEELGQWQTPVDTNSCIVPLAPSPTHGEITVQQQLCEIWSLKSNAVSVSPLPASALMPEVVEPLRPCGGAVRVRNVRPGTWVTIRSSILRAPIGEVFVRGTTEVDITVAPLLIPGDFVDCVVTGCGGEVRARVRVLAEALQDLSAPRIFGPIYDDPRLQGGRVLVDDVVPGAFVDIFVDGVWRTGRFIGGPQGHLITGDLPLHSSITARQRLCGLVSRESVPALVYPAPPVPDFTADPRRGIVPLPVRFTNRTTGVVDLYEWDFGDGSAVAHDRNPSHTYTVPGEYRVSMGATGPSRERRTAVQTIVVLPPTPVAAFEPRMTTGMAPLVITFMDRSTGEIGNHLWELPGAEPATSSQPSPTVRYSRAGTFDVHLTITGRGAEQTSDARGQVVVSPPRPTTRTLTLSVAISGDVDTAVSGVSYRLRTVDFYVTGVGAPPSPIPGRPVGLAGLGADVTLPEGTYNVRAVLYYQYSRSPLETWTDGGPLTSYPLATVVISGVDRAVYFSFGYSPTAGDYLRPTIL